MCINKIIYTNDYMYVHFMKTNIQILKNKNLLMFIK